MNIRLDYSDIKFQENGKLKLLIIVGAPTPWATVRPFPKK